ncbi:primosomal protein N' [Haloimpatiens sp. FM7330]|uniref:primosomal protein N' n=1 Tax=Haloimpatiens sp. FM7330 TaxID=3298610 RepID=UPI0036294373
MVNNDSKQVDRIFTYAIPKELLEKIDLGFRVKVPFGKGNRMVYGFVVEFYDVIDASIKKIKYIKSMCDDFPVLREKDLKLITIMREKYLCTYIECIKTILPNGMFKGISNKVKNVIRTGENLKDRFCKEPYVLIYNIVKKNEGKFNKNELSKKFSVSMSSINTMIKHGFLEQGKLIVNRYNERQYKAYEEKILNDDQKKAVDMILNCKKNISLIHGITGSGKTEIYMNLVSIMLQQGKDSIILVPEIALTPQMVERFKGRFGKDITVFHSKLSLGEKYDEWLRVKNGKVKVAIGARSAIFLPFENLGLIVIDEEHETSYKSESDPKYMAKEIAILKSHIENCKVVLGTATPCIETYYEAMRDEVELITMNKRADGASLPKIEVVDMREELMNNNRSIFSRKLFSSIKEKIAKKEQVILFLNRRGFSTFVSCRKCGYVFKCSNCDIALTYHSEGDYLSCHYCGNKQKALRVCPSCGSKYVKYFGIGTEKVEREIKKYFPKVNTLRMDFDTTRKKDSYENIYNKFKNGEADILIGTQMVAKGLDFSNVTLVGVIAADLSLNLPDFKSAERTFQLITQVSGRAGRGKKKGEVVVQTYNPDNYSIKCAASNDYDDFYKKEITIRRDMNYPPFSNIFCINMSSENENLLIKNIQNVAINLKKIISKNDKIELLGPCPCVISKIKNNYRWQIILKGDINNKYARKIKKLVYEIVKYDYNSIRISMDINPINML